jgi:alkanesulfonate monooxygenase SsuD/methylene tetrahydromethanopterin reductase-like flavin-dependent oxidoreductase (luciferase family)
MSAPNPAQSPAHNFAHSPTPDPGPRRALRIGFAAQVEHTGIAVGGDRATSRGLGEGIELFQEAEELGFDVGYLRTRHLQDAVSSPLIVLAALGQRVTRMQLGTAVIPLRFENAGRLAEDLATADLMLEGRLRPGVSSGYSAKDTVNVEAFGHVRGEIGEHVDRVLAQLLALLDGDIVGTADQHVEGVDSGTPLRIRPQVPGLRSRIAYGAASPDRAARAGAAGMHLQLATMAPDDGTGRSFEQLQLEALHAYREASRTAGHGEGHVMVSRQMIPVADDGQLERFMTLIPRERSKVAGTSTEYRGTEIGGHSAVYSQVVIDDPGVVAQALLADAVVHEADELALVLPFGAEAAEQRMVLRTFAQQVVPHLAGAII